MKEKTLRSKPEKLRSASMERINFPFGFNLAVERPDALRWYFTTRWMENDANVPTPDDSLKSMIQNGEHENDDVLNTVFEHVFDRLPGSFIIRRQRVGLPGRIDRAMHATMKTWDASGDQTREKAINHYISSLNLGWDLKEITFKKKKAFTIIDMRVDEKKDRKQVDDILFNWSPKAMRHAINDVACVYKKEPTHVPTEHLKKFLRVVEKSDEPGTYIFANPVHEEYIKDLVSSSIVILDCPLAKHLAWKEALKGDAANQTFLDAAKSCKR